MKTTGPLALGELTPETSRLLWTCLNRRDFDLWRLFSELSNGPSSELGCELHGLVGSLLNAPEGRAALTTRLESDREVRERLEHWQQSGFFTDDPDLAMRAAALREVQSHLYSIVGELDAASLEPPGAGDRACVAVPGLFPLLSGRDGLLTIRPEMVPKKGLGTDPFLIVGEHAVFPHRFVRSLRELCGDLLRLAVSGREVQVAIDPNRVVPRAEALALYELDYWWGMRLDPERLDDPTHLPRTRHERRVDDHAGKLYPLIATDFSWSLCDGLKQLEVEETVRADGNSCRVKDLVLNRYLHSLRDMEARHFSHLDGAVKAHATDDYQATVDDPAASKGEVVAYRKMFRLDGPIPDDEWARLVAHYLRGNEHVIEYFGEAVDERP